MIFKNLFCLACLLLTINFSIVAQQPCKPPVALPAPTEPNIFSEEQEIYLGEAVAEHIQRYYKVIEDPEITTYLKTIGERLTKNLPLNKLRFEFFLVDLPDANAFVLPGGRIFVSRKLVAAALNEDELAGVIAHELGHLDAGAIVSFWDRPAETQGKRAHPQSREELTQSDNAEGVG